MSKPDKVYNLNDIKDSIRPLDIVFFRGSDFVSDFISWSQKASIKSSKKFVLESKYDFSHCGIVITKEIIDHPNMIEGRLYVLESTASGILGNNVKSIDGKTLVGVQIRDLEALVPAYRSSKKAKVAIGTLKTHPFNTIGHKEVRNIFQKFFTYVDGKYYDADPIVLGSAVCFRARKLKEKLRKGGDQFFFCSELIAELYKRLEMINEKTNVEYCVPMDFLGKDVDEYIPKDFVTEVRYVK